jgi:hypothetical protein
VRSNDLNRHLGESRLSASLVHAGFAQMLDHSPNGAVRLTLTDVPQQSQLIISSGSE